VFYLQYLWAEVRRRPGRTVLTALGLAVGVGLVVIVGALSKGLDDAQEAVLAPLTGVGTDLSVSRPIVVPGDGGSRGGDPFGQLSPEEQRRLQRENEEHNQQFNFGELGEPGERFSRDSFLSTELSFAASEVAKIRVLDGVENAAASLSLNAIHIEGTVPASGAPPVGPGAHAPGGFGAQGGFELETLTVSGVDVREPGLARATPDQVAKGRYFSAAPARARGEAVVDLAFARQNGIDVGDTTRVAGEAFDVVGLASGPLGGDAADVYVELGRLQELSDREGRVNEILVRADSAAAVDGLAARITAQLEGADVVTASDLAGRVGGSLADADDLSAKLGAALAIVALLAAFLIATLLTLSSVQKRTRELGTLKALGWRRRLVVRQVTGESVVQGALGGLLGAALGMAGAGIVNAIGPTLEASVEEQSSGGFGPFGQGHVTAGSTDVVLEAPLDLGLLVLAIGLAIVGGLLAGIAGGLRAARLRPAEALRSTE
jgi:ABC-type antimicrobial peptide transport system permease subunit